MSELHGLLWTLCRKLPTDFAPYGKRDRHTAEPWQDCSRGCRHFISLTGELGYDLGICANPKSPRAGLLTFEHQGCPQFKTEKETAQAKAAAEIPSALATGPQAVVPDAPRRKLRIDFEDLLLALEGFGSEDREHYLDLVDALSRNKPFRRFKDIVHPDLALREEWFAFRDHALAQTARDWLQAEGIDAELLRCQQ